VILVFGRRWLIRFVWTFVIGIGCCLPVTGFGSSGADDAKPSEAQQAAKAARDKETEDAFR
jgi:hypothetical protein